MLNLVPESFIVPETWKGSDFIASKLCANDTAEDYRVVMANIDIIRKTRGGDWPTPGLTFEDDLIDLSWHQREFEYRSSFAYKIMDAEATECIGCFYLYKPGFRREVPDGTDVDISFWVTQQAYDTGLYKIIYEELREWLATEWKFTQPFWSNTEIPN